MSAPDSVVRRERRRLEGARDSVVSLETQTVSIALSDSAHFLLNMVKCESNFQFGVKPFRERELL